MNYIRLAFLLFCYQPLLLMSLDAQPISKIIPAAQAPSKILPTPQAPSKSNPPTQESLTNKLADNHIQLPKLARLGVESPLKIQVKGIAVGSYMGTIADSGKQMIVQVGLGAAGADQAVMIVPADLELTGQTLSLKAIALKTQGVTIEDNGDSMQVNVGGKPFFSALAQSGNKPVIYPIYGPSGVEMTRNYPMKDVAGEQRDHPHQRSMWMTFGKVNNLDFWASDPINGDKKHFGKIKVVSVEASQGTLAGSIRSDKEWLDHEGKLVLNERCTIVVYNLGDQRIMDADFVLTAPDNAPVVFGDTKEGMFGLRVPSLLDTKAKKGGKIVNAEGIADDAAWGKSSSWVDYSGLIDGKTVGVAILNHLTGMSAITDFLLQIPLAIKTSGLVKRVNISWRPASPCTSAIGSSSITDATTKPKLQTPSRHMLLVSPENWAEQVKADFHDPDQSRSGLFVVCLWPG